MRSRGSRSLEHMVVLREFLYRRDDLVDQFLAQLEGGLYDEEHVTDQSGSSGGLGGGVAVGSLNATADRQRETQRESQRTLRQTPESRFNRVHSLLSGQEAVQYLSSFDDDIWNQLQRNEIVEIDASIALAPGVMDLNNLSALSGAAPLIDLMRSLPKELLPDTFDAAEADKMSKQLPLMEQLAEAFTQAPVPCIVSLAGAPRYSFFAELLRDALLADLGDLEGEATVLAKIQRFIEKGRPETLGAGPMPSVPVNREQRRQQKDGGPMTVRVSWPAAVISVVGIYR